MRRFDPRLMLQWTGDLFARIEAEEPERAARLRSTFLPPHWLVVMDVGTEREGWVETNGLVLPGRKTTRVEFVCHWWREHEDGRRELRPLDDRLFEFIAENDPKRRFGGTDFEAFKRWCGERREMAARERASAVEEMVEAGVEEAVRAL